MSLANTPMTAFACQALTERYGIMPATLEPVRGGWSASAFRAKTKKDGFFVKVYDKNRPSVQPWVARIQDYMPAVLWLHKQETMRHRMNAPLLTGDGAYKVENDAYLLMVFPLIEGASLAENRLTPVQVQQLAQTLATLHSYGDEIPVPTAALREDYALPFLPGLRETLIKIPDALHSVLRPHARLIAQKIDDLCLLAAKLKERGPGHVLCHTDVHGWNLMWDGSLVLIDWEGLRLAPAEADLFSFTDGFFFDYAQEPFFKAYRQARGGYQTDHTAMSFYRLRRRLEDIAAFVDSIIHDDLSPEELDRSFYHLKKECKQLDKTP